MSCKTKVHIRWMIMRDMDEVLAIEAESFEFPWKMSDFQGTLRHRNTIGMVAERGNRLLGFMVYTLQKTKIHVLNFAVAADSRRVGVGSQMVEKLVEKLGKQRRARLSLEVRESNLAAQLFFKQAGFRATNVLRGFYDDTDEDAYLFTRTKSATLPAEVL
jgi:ribosomal-protein-alanine N-acetyltransferase